MEYIIDFSRKTYKENYRVTWLLITKKHQKDVVVQIHLSQGIHEGTNLKIVKPLGVNEDRLDGFIDTLIRASKTLNFEELSNFMETLKLTL